MGQFFDMLSAAVYAVIVQNLVFSGGYGTSEAIRMAASPRKLTSLAGMIIWFSVITSVLCRELDFIPAVAAKGQAVHFVIFLGVLSAVYILTCLITLIVLKPSEKLMTKFGVAAMNTLVLAIPLINYRSSNTLWESIGTGIGSGLAFVIASVLINAGFMRISLSKKIPSVFRGAPAMFIYAAILSMTFMGISGSKLFA